MALQGQNFLAAGGKTREQKKKLCKTNHCGIGVTSGPQFAIDGLSYSVPSAFVFILSTRRYTFPPQLCSPKPCRTVI